MQPAKKTNDLGAALMLMLLAPLVTEILPGATRLSSIFVLPIEICVWGGGALMIRYAARRRQLGWRGILLMGLALSLAEEFVIQQTSVAPMVIHLKGAEYARAGGINYVYLLWALIYETVSVVLLPIYLVELIFPSRKERLWISKGGWFAVIPLFLLGSFLAWFTWTRIAREKVFHVPVYSPPAITTLIAVGTIILLIYIAMTRFRGAGSQGTAGQRVVAPGRVAASPNSIMLFIAGAIWSTILFGLVLLGFGIAPTFPPLTAIVIGVVLLAAGLYFVPQWSADARWQSNKRYSLIYGIMLGSMLVSFVGFIDTGGPDLYFKIITNILAIGLMILLGVRINKRVS
ncbi:MAG TPA: hypothetical protein VNU72_13365 [Puia sp.]|nr:hypothetical protein [Puia sp.]